MPSPLATAAKAIPAALILSAALAVTPALAAAPHADVVVLMDESGSMSGEQAWMRGVIPALDNGLVAAQMLDNHFGLIGFGASAAPSPSRVRDFMVGGQQMGTAAAWVTASAGLVVSGGTEDGWAAIQRALTYPLRTTAARNFILVTDEDRDNTNASLSFAGLRDSLLTEKTLLNVVVNNTFRCGDGSAALGVIGTTGYRASAGGGFSTCTNATAVGTNNSRVQYVDLALATGGGAWNLNLLRAGGNSAQSFTQAFLAGKITEITTQIPVVPEPSTWALLSCGIATVWLTRRRRV